MTTLNPATGNPFRHAGREQARPGNFNTARSLLTELRQLDPAQGQAKADEWNLAREYGQYTAAYAYAQNDVVIALLREIRKAHKESKPRETHTVPTGRYAIGDADATRFFRVVVSEDGFTKVQAQASDDLHDLAWNRGLPVLREIEAAGIEAARTRYGVEIGRCWRCGRTLTDATSRAQGIGPDCITKI